MAQTKTGASTEAVEVVNGAGASSVVLVCEHASAHIPDIFDNLGLEAAQRESHAVWDPGAMAVARQMSQTLDAALVAGTVSRLVYDCNRPPEAADAMPAVSEVIVVPGNAALTSAQRADRVNHYYAPFRTALAQQIAKTAHPIIVTIHSFTPIYHGQVRDVEIGVLHDADTRLADAMLALADNHMSENVQRNQPYGPSNGVTHTLKEHALNGGHLNVMLEIRNDLIANVETQRAMAERLSRWIVAAFARTEVAGDVACPA